MNGDQTQQLLPSVSLTSFFNKKSTSADTPTPSKIAPSITVTTKLFKSGSCRMLIVKLKADPAGGANTIRPLKEESLWMMLEWIWKALVLHHGRQWGG